MDLPEKSLRAEPEESCQTSQAPLGQNQGCGKVHHGWEVI